MIRPVRHASALSALLAATLLFVGCESSTTDPDPTPPPVTGVTISAPSTSVAIGATAQLSATVAPSAVSQAVTWSTSEPTRASVSANGLVTALFPGTARITATSVADPSRSAFVDLVVTGCAPLTATDVANGGTLQAGVCYQVQSALTVSAGTLTIQPGVRVEFGTNGALTIGSNGRLNALGIKTNGITLTGVGATGTWRGLRFDNSRGATNVLDYVTIDRAGSSAWSGAAYSTSALLLEGSSLVDLRHSTINGSGGQGITLYSGAELVSQGNTLSNNAVAAWTHPNSARYFDSGTTFTGNTANVVRVAFGNTDAVTTAQTWQRLDVPYEVQTRMFIDATLTLDPGVVLAANDDVSLIVRNGGALRAVGTSALPIRLTSTVNAPDSWKGLQITTASLDNVFDHVTFENGGSEAWTGASDSRAMVYLEGNSKAVITNSTFRGSGHYGLWVPSGGDITGFDGNTFTANARGMIVHPNRAGAISANNTFSSNTENKVRVTFGNTDRVLNAQTWNNFGAPFYVTTRTFVEAPLTIAAGTALEFAQDASLLVTNGGALRANGSAVSPVVFRGGQDLIGYWKGIEYDTFSADNVLSNVVFSNAGSEAWTGGANSTSTVHVTADGLLALSNVTFSQDRRVCRDRT